jgi:hypothetical protein
MALTFESAEALVQIVMGNEKEVDTWLPSCYKLSRVQTGDLRMNALREKV